MTAHYFLGAVALCQGRVTEAISRCQEAVVIDPNVYADVYANLSYCCSAVGDGEQARKAQSEYELRTGKPLQKRELPGVIPMTGYVQEQRQICVCRAAPKSVGSANCGTVDEK